MPLTAHSTVPVLPRIQKAIYTSAGYHYYLTVHRDCVTLYGPDGPEYPEKLSFSRIGG